MTDRVAGYSRQPLVAIWRVRVEVVFGNWTGGAAHQEVNARLLRGQPTFSAGVIWIYKANIFRVARIDRSVPKRLSSMPVHHGVACLMADSARRHPAC
jgi:hypothetical protein